MQTMPGRRIAPVVPQPLGKRVRILWNQEVLRKPPQTFSPLPGKEGALVDYSPETGICIWDHIVKLPDGYLSLLKRMYKGDPEHPPKEGRRVKLLVHGYAENGNIWRLDQNGEILNIGEIDSVANDLANRGYDVWIAHFWGKRVYERYARNIYGPHFPYVKPSDISFDHIVQWDMPEVLAKIKEVVEDDKGFAAVGHSTGGSILYAYKGWSGDPSLARIAALGAPVRLDPDTDLIANILVANAIAAGLGMVETNPFSLVFDNIDFFTRHIARVPAPVLRFFPGTEVLFAGDVTGRVRQGFFKRAAETISPLLTMFYAQMQMTGCFASLREMQAEELIGWIKKSYSVPVAAWVIEALRSLGIYKSFSYSGGDGLQEVDYAAAMRSIEIPLLILSGELDKLVPPRCAAPAIDMVGSKNKCYKLVPGTSHIGLVASRHSQREIREQIVEFLEGGKTFST